MVKYFTSATGFSRTTIISIIILSLLVHLAAGWFSIGFYHYDEHYQILEFAALKAGLTTENDLAWEYKARIRPTLQPWIAYSVIKLHALVRSHDPFTVAGILRVITAIMGWGVSLLVAATSFKWIQNESMRRIILCLSMFLWFIIFMDARFSSESWAGLFFFSGISLLILNGALNRRSNADNSNLRFLLGCGFLLGLSIVFRLQMILLLPGLGLWCLLLAKTPFKRLIYLAIGAALALFIGFVSDYMFYGEYVNSAWRYYVVNIKEGKAATFGVEPWWWYIPAFLRDSYPPLSYIILILVVIGWISYRKNILTWTCVPFVILHMFIAHKELRFLFPIAHVMPIFIVFGIITIVNFIKKNAFLSYKHYLLKAFYIILAVFFILNLKLMAEYSVKPTRGVLKPMRYIYSEFGKNKEVDVIVPDKGEYELLSGLPMNFYIMPNVHLYRRNEVNRMQRHINSATNPVVLVIRHHGFQFPDKYKSLESQTGEYIYYTMPGWINIVNLNNWVSRTPFWRVYHFNPNSKVNTK